MTQSNKKTQAGFTLIELSIVLVIIGLIVGGVLVGQDLIKAAEVRAAVSQIEKYDAAANTFRGKYSGLPGDLTGAANFGLVTATGDGDGLIDPDISIGADATDNGTEFATEAAAFFSHLADVNMISESITAYAGATTTKTVAYAAADIDVTTNFMPASKLGRGALVAVRGAAGQNYFYLSVPAITNGVGTFTDGSQIQVLDAKNIDDKFDDGLPTTGRVIAVTNFATADSGGAAADDICVNTTPDPDVYNMGDVDRQKDTECMVRIRTSF